MLHFECVLHILIEFIHVDVCKKLRGEIANGNSIGKASNNFGQESHHFFIMYSLLHNFEQNLVIHRCKKPVDITLKSETGSCVIAADLPEHLRKSINTFVRSFSSATRKGMRDESRLKDGIQCGKNRMMRDAVAHGRLVDLALLGIADGESIVTAVSVVT